MVVEYSSAIFAAGCSDWRSRSANGTKVWQRRDRKAQFAAWGVYARRRRHLHLLLESHFRQGRSGRSCSMRRRRPPTSAPHVRPDWGSIHGCGGRSGTRSNIATLARHGDRSRGAVAYCAATQHHAERRFCGPWRCSSSCRRARSFADLGADARPPSSGLACSPASCRFALRSIGFCAKLLYEAIEEIDESQVEAVRATGATRAQVDGLRHRCRRCCRPSPASSVFRWDINIRESTVLGLVGAGASACRSNAAITTLAWTQVSLSC